LFPGDGVVDPRDVVRALRIACEKRGVAIREFSPVLRADCRGGRAVLSTSAGEVQADAAVLAAGAWNSEIQTIEAAPQTFPVRGHLLGYQLAPGALPCILRRGHTYLLQRASGLFIAGASSECVGFDRTVDAAIVERLRTEAEDLYAPLRGLKPDPWIGFRPATPSYQPEIRRLAGSSLWLACGHFRNGILLAPDTARRVADAISGAS
jgi:glycine oxidase